MKLVFGTQCLESYYEQIKLSVHVKTQLAIKIKIEIVLPQSESLDF